MSQNISAAEPVHLCAGPLEMVFEPEHAFLRYINWGGVEVLRGIYAAVRDANWDTVPPLVRRLEIDQGADSFQIDFSIQCTLRAVDFVWDGRLVGRSNGEVDFSFSGEALTDFSRNRIGFCVLHPAAAAGLACRVEKVDGSIEEGIFPQLISPHQPFMDMAAIRHQIGPEVWFEVRFAGDTFEMEDQRNWTDASYKTYCTPLGLPFPVSIEAGDKVRQQVSLRLLGEIATGKGPAPVQVDTIAVACKEDQRPPLMPIGLGVASEEPPLDQPEIERLQALGLNHLRLDLDLGQGVWDEGLQEGIAQAKALGVGLELGLFLRGDERVLLQRLQQSLESSGVPVAAFNIYGAAQMTTPNNCIELAKEYLASAPLGAGTNAYFTELNRGCPPVEHLDFVCYSLNPQVHAFDNASLVETLPVQGTTVESARHLGGGLPVAISPISLKPRFNPNATGPEPDPPPGHLPESVDKRQASLFAAGWTLGSIKYLAQSKAGRVTYYETIGPRGVMCGSGGVGFSKSGKGVFPLYHLLADVGEFVGGQVVESQSSDPLRLETLVLAKGPRRRVLLANLSQRPLKVELARGVINGPIALKRLDRDCLEEALEKPEEYRVQPGQRLGFKGGTLDIELPGWGLARLDGGGQ